MALLPRADLVRIEYAPAPPPFSGDPKDERIRYLVEELDRIKNVIRELADACPQCADAEPARPRKGLVRLPVAPWDPLSNGSLPIYVVYDGTAWTAL